MTPWQVAVGFTIALALPALYLVTLELDYLSGYWTFIWGRYWYHLTLFVGTALLLTFFGLYQVARVLSLGDVGRRVQVLDRSIREGKTGDPDLVEGLRRETEGDYKS